MCGGSNDGCGYLVANMLYVSERLASCCAATGVVVCLVGTLLVMLALGVGLGYNYCVVDHRLLTITPSESDEPTTKPPESGKGRRRKRGFPLSSPAPAARPGAAPASLETHAHVTHATHATHATPAALAHVKDADIKPTMTIPLQQYNIHSLLAKLRKYNKNVTLHLVL